MRDIGHKVRPNAFHEPELGDILSDQEPQILAVGNNRMSSCVDSVMGEGIPTVLW